MLNRFSCEGKVAIVTGASRGLGKAIALTLAEAGADVVIAARGREQLAEAAERIAETGRRCLSVATDVTKPEQVDSMVARAYSEMGRVDILVCNAGTQLIKPVVPMPATGPDPGQRPPGERISDGEWREILDTNLSSAFFCVRAAGPYMMKAKYGKVIVISSVGGLRGHSYEVPYCSTKGALLMLVRSLAVEWARYNINVNAIAPGVMAAGLVLELLKDQALIERRLRTVPLRRMGQPEDVALAALFLASSASDYITGQVLSVDGGETA